MAHYFAAMLAAEDKLFLKFSSAGLAANPGIELPEVVSKLLKKVGVKKFTHIPVMLTAKSAESADLILAMTAAHKARIIGLYPAAAEKTFTLARFAGLPDGDIPDPYGRGDKFYAEIFALIRSAVKASIEKLKNK